MTPKENVFFIVESHPGSSQIEPNYPSGIQNILQNTVLHRRDFLSWTLHGNVNTLRYRKRCILTCWILLIMGTSCVFKLKYIIIIWGLGRVGKQNQTHKLTDRNFLGWTIIVMMYSHMALAVENPSANTRDMGLTTGSGRCSGVGNGNLLPYSCLGNLKDREAWWAAVHGSIVLAGYSPESQDMTERLNTHVYTHMDSYLIPCVKYYNFFTYSHFMTVTILLP